MKRFRQPNRVESLDLNGTNAAPRSSMIFCNLATHLKAPPPPRLALPRAPPRLALPRAPPRARTWQPRRRRIAPLLGAAARIHATRSYGRHRAWQRSSRVAVLFLLAVASLRLLGAALAICAWLAAAATYTRRSHGRNRVQQRSSRVDVLFLLAVASFHRVRHRSSRVAVASRRVLGAATVIYFFAVSCFFRVFYLQYQNSKRTDSWF
jgi:hypothetical protein